MSGGYQITHISDTLAATFHEHCLVTARVSVSQPGANTGHDLIVAVYKRKYPLLFEGDEVVPHEISLTPLIGIESLLPAGLLHQVLGFRKGRHQVP